MTWPVPESRRSGSGQGRAVSVSVKLELPMSHTTGPERDTFCVHPWITLELTAEGWLRPCGCSYGLIEDDDGAPLNVTERPLEELWNSQAMLGFRRRLVAGHSVATCAGCYQQEAAGGPSSRRRDNASWEAGWLNDERHTLAGLQAETQAADYHVPGGPINLYLRMGNVCNLQCRMCNGASSSRFARDSVNTAWADAWAPGRPGEAWFGNPRILREHVLAHPERLRQLSFFGGETLLIKEVGDILRYLVDAGVAHQVTVSIFTNGTTAKAPWLQLTGAFQGFVLLISLDGYGTVNDYIRHPSRWDTIVANLESFQQLPNVILGVAPVLQAYNALSIVDLFRFVDAAGLFYVTEALLDPTYLRTTVLPPAVRQVAAERLRAYASAGCRPENREHVEALATWVESDADVFDEGALREFMLFTNDLDASHGKRFREELPELFELITASGFEWTDETRHAL
jgi:MoaA/NifB/PqqE/SkfB family radical SAM enzyme